MVVIITRREGVACCKLKIKKTFSDSENQNAAFCRRDVFNVDERCHFYILSIIVTVAVYCPAGSIKYKIANLFLFLQTPTSLQTFYIRSINLR